jgi:hypothetical protein
VTVLAAERERLVAALRERGVDYLAPSDARGEPLADAALIARLASSADPRLRQALIALFLLHPDLAPLVPSVRQELDPDAETELLAHYMAAVYLQRLWRTRLKMHVGGFLELPDFFSASLGLPGAEEGYGKPGLYALAEWHRRQSASAYNRLAEYHGVVEHVFASLSLRRPSHERTVTR